MEANPNPDASHNVGKVDDHEYQLNEASEISLFFHRCFLKDEHQKSVDGIHQSKNMDQS